MFNLHSWSCFLLLSFVAKLSTVPSTETEGGGLVSEKAQQASLHSSSASPPSSDCVSAYYLPFLSTSANNLRAQSATLCWTKWAFFSGVRVFHLCTRSKWWLVLISSRTGCTCAALLRLFSVCACVVQRCVSIFEIVEMNSPYLSHHIFAVVKEVLKIKSQCHFVTTHNNKSCIYNWPVSEVGGFVLPVNV